MSENKKPIITIHREYGAGGRTVARKIANELGIQFYDKDFIKATAAASGYTEEQIAEVGEELSGSTKFLNRFLPSVYNDPTNEIYEAQKTVILNLAKEPCIIVGRCSNLVLQEAGIPCYNIFLYCDDEHRMKHAAELNPDMADAELQKEVEKLQKRRINYYTTYTKHDFYSCKDYNIAIDTGTIGFDKTAEVLLAILKPLYE